MIFTERYSYGKEMGKLREIGLFYGNVNGEARWKFSYEKIMAIIIVAIISDE